MPSNIRHRWIAERLLATTAAALLGASAAAAQEMPAADDTGAVGLRGSVLSAPPSVPDVTTAPLRATDTATDDAQAQPPDDGTPNYGKPRKPTKQYGPRKAIIRNPLPVLEPYATAPSVRRARRRGAPLEPDAPPAPTVAAIPRPETRRKPAPDPNPYAPVGVGVGGLRLTPYVESDIGYDTNPDQTSPKGRGSGFTHVEGGLGLQSDWSNHSLSGQLRGGYFDYFSDHSADRPEASGTIDGRIDVTRDTKIDLESRFDVSTQRPGSPEITAVTGGATVIGRPLVSSYGGTLGVSQDLGRLTLSLRGTADRYEYEDAKFSDGSIAALSQENYTAYGLRGRATYTVTPGVAPFLEAFGDLREHDHKLDPSGYARDSTGEGVLVGSTFELTRKLTGEVDTGYENRSYDDNRLRDLRGPLVDAQLVWSATPLTTVTFNSSTSFDETNIPGASGAISRAFKLDVSHALLRNLTLTGSAGLTNTNYTGIKLTENTYDLGFKADYNLSRSIVIRGSFTHERLKSTANGNDYTQNVFLLGLRLQR